MGEEVYRYSINRKKNVTFLLKRAARAVIDGDWGIGEMAFENTDPKAEAREGRLLGPQEVQ